MFRTGNTKPKSGESGINSLKNDIKLFYIMNYKAGGTWQLKRIKEKGASVATGQVQGECGLVWSLCP